MNPHLIRKPSTCLLACLVYLSLLVPAARGQQYVMMPDSTNNRLVLFDPFNGALVNGNLFALAGGTPIHAMQVGSEIWVSEQVGDRISRWDFSGASLGSISGGLDNIRGMAQANGTIYVTNAGTANGAPGAAIVMFNSLGTNLGFFSTTTTSPSPFGILPYAGGLLVSSAVANDDIHRYTLTGSSLGTFHNSTNVNFAQQMAYRSNGNVLVSGFSSPGGVFELDSSSGSILNNWAPLLGQRGVFQLGNGNILWTNGSGAFVLDPGTGTSTQVYVGVGRYLDLYTVPVPEPGVAGLFGLSALFVGFRRRRNG